MEQIFNAKTQRVPIKSWADDADQETMRQALNLANLPFVVSHVALMPDAHLGFGMPIGGVIAAEGVIVPNAVGVDIGCGVVAWNTGIEAGKLGPYLQDIIESLYQNVPVGFKHRNPSQAQHLAKRWCPQFLDLLAGKPNSFLEVCVEQGSRKAAGKSHSKIIEQIGTLGGGNHFIELQVDPQRVAWVMLHSGSRNVGLQINTHFHRLARQLCQQAGTTPSDASLSYLALNSEEGQDYIAHMQFALDFARYNRHMMMRFCQDAVRRTPVGKAASDGDDLINIHHNYAEQEQHYGKKVWVHRKGATSARVGQLGIIPGSMGTKSYIVRGKGNAESFNSCSHGAGRVLGRKEAKRKISLDRFRKSMEGVLFKCSPRHLDEAPDAYKNLDRVMANQSDLVEIVTELRPLAVVKG